MVDLPIELGQGRPEVRAHLRHEVFAPVGHLRVEHAAAIFGDEHQVDVQVAGDASAAAGCRVWLPAACLWSCVLCGPGGSACMRAPHRKCSCWSSAAMPDTCGTSAWSSP